MAGFGAQVAAMDAKLMRSLGDGMAAYHDDSGRCVARDIEVMVDPNLQQNGPDGVFITLAVGISWRSGQLKGVTRGGVFQHGKKRYQVEALIIDDGQWPVAACMELK